MAVNVRLRVLRAERGLSQMAVAAKARIGLNKYWRIENGYQTPDEDDRKAIAAAFELTEPEAFPEAVAS